LSSDRQKDAQIAGMIRHTPHVKRTVGDSIGSNTPGRPGMNGYHVCIRDHVAGINPPAPGESNEYYHWVSL